MIAQIKKKTKWMKKKYFKSIGINKNLIKFYKEIGKQKRQWLANTEQLTFQWILQ